MLQIIESLPPYVFGVRAKNEVTKADIETVLVPGLQYLVDTYNEIHYLLVLETAVQNWTAGAWVADMKAGIEHFLKWKKIAVVTPQTAVETFTDIFSMVTPGAARGYSADELEEAKRWVSEK